MPDLKSLLMLLVVTIVAAGATLYVKDQIYTLQHATDNTAVTSTASMVTIIDSVSSTSAQEPAITETPTTPTPKPPVTPPQGIVPSLSGKLTEVNTGCFSDGVCYAVVDSKKVILLIGRYQGSIGKIIGADSIGDLENYIGADATVFAGMNDEGEYTLLGNESFYLQVSKDTKPVTGGACVVGGCSSQLCGEESEMNDMVTTCEYQTKYSCYQKATCERQTTGKCGWTETPELAMCLKNNS